MTGKKAAYTYAVDFSIRGSNKEHTDTWKSTNIDMWRL